MSKNVGLFYGKSTDKTAKAAEMIKEVWGDGIELVEVENATLDDFKRFDYMVLGAATWFDGELPSYWDETLPELDGEDLKGHRVAIYALGDQVNYPDNFADSLGLLAHRIEATGVEVVGYTSTEGYDFVRSLGETPDEKHFMGLVLDFENQADKNEERIKAWVKQVKKEFGL